MVIGLDTVLTAPLQSSSTSIGPPGFKPQLVEIHGQTGAGVGVVEGGEIKTVFIFIGKQVRRAIGGVALHGTERFFDSGQRVDPGIVQEFFGAFLARGASAHG